MDVESPRVGTGPLDPEDAVFENATVPGFKRVKGRTTSSSI